MRLLLMKTLSNLARELESVFNKLDQRVRLKTSKSLQQWVVECVSALAYTLTLAVSMFIMVLAVMLVLIYLITAHMIELLIKGFKELHQHIKSKEKWQSN